MPLVYHKIEDVHGEKAGASVEVFLSEGLKSKAILRQEGKLEKVESAYERGQENRRRWIEERKKALADKPEILRHVLSSDRESTWVSEFDKPGFAGNREESVFFGYDKNPPSDKDWVAINARDNETVHDASFRDENSPSRWLGTSVPLAKYVMEHEKGIPGWLSKYNEILRKDRLTPSEIIAYAKVEKELPLSGPLDEGKKRGIIQELSQRLEEFTQFDDPTKNILPEVKDGVLRIRVAFNTKKAGTVEAQERIQRTFADISSMDDLVVRPTEPTGADSNRQRPLSDLRR